MNYTCYSAELEEVTHLWVGSFGEGGSVFNHSCLYRGLSLIVGTWVIPFLTLSLLRSSTS